MQESPILDPKCFVSTITWGLEERIRADHERHRRPPDCPAGRWYVTKSLRPELLAWIHDQPGTGHPRVGATLRLVERRYWWPRWREEVKSYVNSCTDCAQCKSTNQAPSGLLQPLPVPDRPWSHLTMDFITDLPRSEGKTVILTLVDRFSKMCRLVALPKLPTSTELAEVLVREVFRHTGIPEDLVSDRGPQFASRVFKEFCAKLNITLSLTSAYHPQSNGLAERRNREVAKALRLMTRHDPTKWAPSLTWVEYSLNSRINPATNLSPFQCVLGFQPPLFPWDSPACSVPSVESWYQDSKRTWRAVKEALQSRAEVLKTKADRRRRPGFPIRIGQRVWLSTKNLRIPGCKKFTVRYIGPFPVIQRVGPVAVKLQLPKIYRISPTFHISLLKPVHYSLHRQDIRPAEDMPPVPPSTPAWKISGVVDSHRRQGQLQYLVDWMGADTKERSWVSSREVEDKHLNSRFHLPNPSKPAPRGRGRPRKRRGPPGGGRQGGGSVTFPVPEGR
uniref:Gypsy retrotransposon integrase-like protein 1 n=1 Tax=Paramormyrops kingsleyae TaxID=1676925 RepID=A0A3B3QR72_9TELE